MANTAFKDSLPDSDDPNWDRMSEDAKKANVDARVAENQKLKSEGKELLPVINPKTGLVYKEGESAEEVEEEVSDEDTSTEESTETVKAPKKAKAKKSK